MTVHQIQTVYETVSRRGGVQRDLSTADEMDDLYTIIFSEFCFIPFRTTDHFAVEFDSEADGWKIELRYKVSQCQAVVNSLALSI
jgi:hypothetical protein